MTDRIRVLRPTAELLRRRSSFPGAHQRQSIGREPCRRWAAPVLFQAGRAASVEELVSFHDVQAYRHPVPEQSATAWRRRRASCLLLGAGPRPCPLVRRRPAGAMAVPAGVPHRANAFRRAGGSFS